MAEDYSPPQRVVNFTVFHLKIRRNELNEAIHHLLQIRRISPEGYRCEEHRRIALNDRFGHSATFIILNAHARRLQPAAKATEAVRQFHGVQREGLDQRAVMFEQLR